MIRLIGAEFLKLRTVKIGWIFLGVVLGLTALFSILGLAFHEGSYDDQEVRDFFSVGGSFLVPIFVLLLGIFGFTTEFRHGTIAETFLVTPRREHVLVSKLVTYALVGLLFAVLAIAVTIAIDVPWFHSEGVDVSISDPPIRSILLGALVAAALWGAIGVAVGGAVRNQVGAVIGSLVWLLIVESIFAGFFPDEARFLPGHAGDALSGTATEDVLTRPQGGLVLLAWVVGLSLAAALLLRRRDVT